MRWSVTVGLAMYVVTARPMENQSTSRCDLPARCVYLVRPREEQESDSTSWRVHTVNLEDLEVRQSIL